MAKEKKAATPKRGDPEQSKRFIEAAKKLEAAGELNLTDAGERVSRLVASARSKKGRA